MRNILFFFIIFSISAFTSVNGQTLLQSDSLPTVSNAPSENVLTPLSSDSNYKALQIDSLTYTVRSAQSDNEHMPLSEDDPNYQEPEADLSFFFYINDTIQLNSVELIFSTSNGNGDFKKVKQNLNTKEEKDILLLKNAVRFLGSNKILLRCTVPISIFRKRIYLTMKAFDNNGGESNILYKTFN